MVSISIQNNSPGLNITQDNVIGILGANSNFDPATGVLDINFGIVEGPLSYGTITYLVEDNGVQSNFDIIIIDCCLKNYRPDIIIVNQTSSGLGVPQFNNQSILVLNELYVDDPIGFFDCDIKMGNDARMQLQAGTALTFEQCTITNFCEYRWDGILATNQSTFIEITDSELRGAGRGWQLEEDVVFISTNTTYSVNTRSITALNYQQQGSYYNNSNWQLRGNTFQSANAPLAFHNLSNIPGMMQNPSRFIYIDLNNCLHIQVGEVSQTKNIFKQIEGNSIQAEYTQELTIENNDFLLGSNPIKLNFCKAIIGGPAISYGNRFISNTGIFSESSYQEIGYNAFLYSEATINNPNNYLNGSVESVWMHNNHGEFSDFHIAYIPAVYTADVIIEYNAIINGNLNLTNISTVSNTNGVRVFQNQFGWCALDAGAYNVKLENTQGIRFGSNEFKIMNVIGPSSCPPFTPAIRGRGLLAFNAPNAQFKSNNFNECTLGFYGKGDFTNTLFSCNVFSDNDTGMYFYDALLTNQGVEDPTYPHTGNRIVANEWHNNNSKNLVIKQSASFIGLNSKYVCEDVFNGYGYFYNPENLTLTNTNGFIRIVIGNPSITTWQITPVSTYSVNGLNLDVQHVDDCALLNKAEPQIVPLLKEAYTIFPNPASEKITYHIQEALMADAYICIFNLNGQLLSRHWVNEQTGTLTLDLKSGVYAFVLFNGKNISQSRILIE